MADIFISYSSSDRPKAKALAEAIQQQGWSVWWDREIPFGKSFDQVIEQELDAARCVVVVWTKASIASDWVKTEAAEGARRHVLLPVFMDEVKIPLEFRRLQAANLTTWQPGLPNSEFDQLLRHFGQMLGQPTTAKPRKETAFRPQPVRDSAENGKSESEERSRDTRPDDESNHTRKTRLAISRTPLLIVSGVAALLILIVVIGLKPSGNKPDDRSYRESVPASPAERKTEPTVASTDKGVAQRTSEGIGTSSPTQSLLDELIPKGKRLDPSPGVQPNYAEAVKSTSKSAAQRAPAGISESSLPKPSPDSKAKEAETFYARGEQYYSGSGVKQDYVEAARWYRKAADLDFVPAQRKLALMYKEGIGVAKNEGESLKWEMKVLSEQQKESSKVLEELDKKARDAIRNIKPG